MSSCTGAFILIGSRTFLKMSSELHYESQEKNQSDCLVVTLQVDLICQTWILFTDIFQKSIPPQKNFISHLVDNQKNVPWAPTAVPEDGLQPWVLSVRAGWLSFVHSLPGDLLCKNIIHCAIKVWWYFYRCLKSSQFILYLQLMYSGLRPASEIWGMKDC